MKRTSKKQIRELEETARETIDENARLYARYEKDATGNAYALINGRTHVYKSNSAMYDAVADMVLYPDETAAAQDEAEKAIAEACKAIEAAASGDAAVAELIPQPHRPTGYAKATASDYAELTRMIAAIAR